MATTHTETVLNRLGKSELVQLVLQTEASSVSQITNLTTEVKDLLGYFKKLETDLAVIMNVNSKPMERVVQTERRFWANAQYLRWDTAEVIGISSSIRDQGLEGNVSNLFEEIGVNIDEREIHACHHLKEKHRTIAKSVNRKDCTNILRVKRIWKTLIDLNCSFLRELKHLSTKVYVPVTEAFGINIRSLAQLEYCINFIQLMGLFVLNWKKMVRQKVQLACLI